MMTHEYAMTAEDALWRRSKLGLRLDSGPLFRLGPATVKGASRYPPELAERLFQPFSAGAGGTGSGLGLAIVRTIAESAGGSARLKSPAPGHAHGTVVEIELPLA